MPDQKAYRQTPPFWKRLAARRLSPRQWAVWGAALAVLILAEPDVWTFIVGCVFVAVGLALRAWTFGHLEKNHRLATTGPYAHSRNPAYLGSLAILVGIAIAAGNTVFTNTTLPVPAHEPGAVGLRESEWPDGERGCAPVPATARTKFVPGVQDPSPSGTKQISS